MKKVFIICPVRNATPEVEKTLKSYIRKLERKDCQVHYPPRDTDQNDPIGIRICEANREAILEADEIHIWFDKNSQGMIFDIGMTFAFLRFSGLIPPKKIVLINRDQVQPTEKKSFQNVLLELTNINQERGFIK